MIRVRDKTVSIKKIFKSVSSLGHDLPQVLYMHYKVWLDKCATRRKHKTHAKITDEIKTHSERSLYFQNDENTYGFRTLSKKACKHLWQCCVDHHNFFRLVQVNPTTTYSTTNNTGLFGFGSKLRGSGRSERDVSGDITEVRHRQQPHFTRIPSER